jgi:hypothetical protein
MTVRDLFTAGQPDPAHPATAWGDAVTDAADAVPPGGQSGQVLSKASATDFDTAWATVEGGGGSADPRLAVLAGLRSIPAYETGPSRSGVADSMIGTAAEGSGGWVWSGSGSWSRGQGTSGTFFRATTVGRIVLDPGPDVPVRAGVTAQNMTMSYFGVVFSYVDENNFLTARYMRDGLYVYEMKDGALTGIGSVSAGWSAYALAGSTPYRLEVGWVAWNTRTLWTVRHPHGVLTGNRDGAPQGTKVGIETNASSTLMRDFWVQTGVQ